MTAVGDSTKIIQLADGNKGALSSATPSTGDEIALIRGADGDLIAHKSGAAVIGDEVYLIRDATGQLVAVKSGEVSTCYINPKRFAIVIGDANGAPADGQNFYYAENSTLDLDWYTKTNLAAYGRYARFESNGKPLFLIISFHLYNRPEEPYLQIFVMRNKTTKSLFVHSGSGIYTISSQYGSGLPYPISIWFNSGKLGGSPNIGTWNKIAGAAECVRIPSAVQSYTLNGDSVNDSPIFLFPVCKEQVILFAYSFTDSTPSYTGHGVHYDTTTITQFNTNTKEYETYSLFPVTGEVGYYYIARDTDIAYLWVDTEYVEQTPGPVYVICSFTCDNVSALSSIKFVDVNSYTSDQSYEGTVFNTISGINSSLVVDSFSYTPSKRTFKFLLDVVVNTGTTFVFTSTVSIAT